MFMRIGRGQAIAVSVWVLLLAGGSGYLAAHSARAGTAGPAPQVWPADLSRRNDRWTVVLAAHPRCPCTRASADELIGALAGATEDYELIVLAYRPADDAAFADTGVVRRLGALEHTTVIEDVESALAARFGAMTSGHAAVFDPTGSLRFSGGLTPSRGHAGPNTGAATLRALLRGGQPPAEAAPVYGCPLDNQTSVHTLLGSCTEGDDPCTP
jgi:hypothetical protein